MYVCVCWTHQLFDCFVKASPLKYLFVITCRRKLHDLAISSLF